MSGNLGNWLIFITLSLIWGSSFILMKLGLEQLSAYHVASIRIVVAGLVLLPFAVKNFRKIPKEKLFPVAMSGVLGSLLPAYLFCKAEEGVSGALAGMLNALTPVFAIVIGVCFFQLKISRIKILGIFTAFSGTVLLLLNNGISGSQNFLYIFYIIIATVCYGMNVNLVGRYLKGIPSFTIASVSLLSNAVPALLVLCFTGFFKLPLHDKNLLAATGYAAMLGLVCTSIASILFYQLIKRSGTVFSSMVTYCIPIVAILWGILYGEQVTIAQCLCLLVILAGIFIVNAETIFVKTKTA